MNMWNVRYVHSQIFMYPQPLRYMNILGCDVLVIGRERYTKT